MKGKRKQDPHHRHRGKSSEGLFDKKAVLEGLRIAPGETILDAGCGNGYMAKEFAGLTGKRGKVYALDPDDAVIEALRPETAGTVIEPFVGDMTKGTGLPASSVDLVYLSMVVHGFSPAQMDGLVKEVERILRPRGRLAVVEIQKKETPFGPPLEIRFSPGELRQAIGLAPTRHVELGRYFYLQLFERSA